MENTARLGSVEYHIQDLNVFKKIMHELLRHINNILENPHDFQLRTIKSNIFKDFLKIDVFNEYVRYVGFELKGDKLVYPNVQTLTNLRMAQVAIERKISLCCGSEDGSRVLLHPKPLQQPLTKILPANILTTTNPFLIRVQSLFNDMLRYEDPILLSFAREQIPIVTLQILALDRMREQQRKIKAGETQAKDLPFDIALLMELMSWFKYKFFSWVDKPNCICGGTTITNGAAMQRTKGETCRVELYKCTTCNALIPFPRYNNPRTLLTWRRGRCGEWANCFTLLCRAMNYDVRYVYDVTDHVWCEIYDYDSNTWLHCDPCEAKLNAPLMYSHGWGKQLSYVIAVSRDDLQDVTWRYTTSHNEVLERRRECTEEQLIDSIVKLRHHRQKQGSEARRAYLARRTAIELVQLMKERKPEEFESHGRISGSLEWRQRRGEYGPERELHTFLFTVGGEHTIKYFCAKDRYLVMANATELAPLHTWASGVYSTTGVFRKVEHDWKQAYLAREEEYYTGEVSWKFAALDGFVCTHLSVMLTSKVYEDAKINWTLEFDGLEPVEADLGEITLELKRTFVSVTIRATLTGGIGGVAWQHAQLFRQPLDSDLPAFVVKLKVE